MNKSRTKKNRQQIETKQHTTFIADIYIHVNMLFIVVFDLRFACIRKQVRDLMRARSHEKFMLRCKLLLCLSIVVNHFKLMKIQFDMNYVHKLGTTANISITIDLQDDFCYNKLESLQTIALWP